MIKNKKEINGTVAISKIVHNNKKNNTIKCEHTNKQYCINEENFYGHFECLDCGQIFDDFSYGK